MTLEFKPETVLYPCLDLAIAGFKSVELPMKVWGFTDSVVSLIRTASGDPNTLPVVCDIAEKLLHGKEFWCFFKKVRGLN